jgi:hypothetical protein
MRNASVFKLGMLAGAGLASVAYGHHSVVTHFDMTRTIEIRGTVVDFKLRSPHASMVVEGISYVDGVAQETEAQRWEIESQAAPGLRAMGISRDTFSPGDAITVIAAPNRQPGFRFVNSSNFTDATGRQYSMRNASRPERLTTNGAANTQLTGIYSAPVRQNQPASPLPLNAAGLAAMNSYDPRLSPANTCESMSFPDMFYAPYLFEVKVDGDTISIHNQPWEVTRTVTLDGTPVVTQPEGLFGTITGSREGNAIVLQSTGFPASRWGLGSAVQPLGSGTDIPSSEQKTLAERFSLGEDGLTLVYEYVLQDPMYLSAPYEGRLEFPRVADDTPVYPYLCEEESASMFSRTPEDQQLQVGN